VAAKEKGHQSVTPVRDLRGAFDKAYIFSFLANRVAGFSGG
jgi:hypothetical protein